MPSMQIRLSTGLAALAAAFLPTLATAQTAKSIGEDYDNAIKTAQTITAFGPDIFGESVNLKDGATSFTATDINIKTNSGLPVTIGRTLGINSRDIDEYVDYNAWVADGELFGNWKLDVPYMSGTYDQSTGWVSRMSNPQQRCSVSDLAHAGPPGVPGVYPGWSKSYLPEQYWSGDKVNIPGKGNYPLLYLPSTGTRPNDGKTYYWTTKGDWRVSCLPTIKNGSGEGYLVVLPDGTRYTFDWISSRQVAALKDTNCTASDGCTAEQKVVYRREYFLHATKVEDRHGNWVAYDYDPANPRRLRSITSNDGISIALTYGTNGKVTSISTNGRTWQYQYTTATNAALAAVVLPDGSRWSFQYGDMYWLLQQQKITWLDCEPLAPSGTRTENVTIGHPSGASGVFTFRKIMHGTDRTPGGCSVPDPDKPTQVDIAGKRPVYKVASLVSKQVTGPGMASRTWTYAYQPSYSFNPAAFSDDCSLPSIDCNKTTTTEVTSPDGTITRSTFGNDYFRTAGQLLAVDIVSSGTTVQSTTNTYMTDAAGQNYPDIVGQDPLNTNNRLETEKLRPQRKTQIVRDGTTFTSQVEVCSGTTYCFTYYAKPYKSKRYNSLGTSRTDTIAYTDDATRWVMQQVHSSTNLETGLIESQTDFDSLSRPWKTYAFGKLQATLTYNTDGTLATVADGVGNVTTVTGWKRGIPLSIQHPATPESPSGAVESATVDDNGWITSATDENGYATGYGYDAMGRISAITYPTGDTLTGGATTYNSTSSNFRALTSTDWKPTGVLDGQWRKLESTGNHVSVTYYDALWRPVLTNEYDQNNITTTLRAVRTEYDNSGRKSFESYPASATVPGTTGTRTFYDALDRVTRTEQDSELGVLTTTTLYQTGLKTLVTNPRNQQTTTTFMAWDQPNYDLPILSEQPESKVVQISRQGQFGWPLSMTQRNATGTLSQTRQYVYDSNALLCKSIEPETGATVMDYDAAGNLAWSAAGLSASTYASTTDCQRPTASASGRATTRTYDARNRLKQLLFPDGLGNQAWTYTPDSRPASITTYNGTGNTLPVLTAYNYNHRRLLTGETLTQTGWYSWTIGYAYDAYGNLASQTYPTGLTVDYAPNPLGQATKAGAYATGAQYYPNGALKQFTYGNGIVHSMIQNARQLPSRVTSSGGVTDFGYTYDANANIAAIADYARGSGYDRTMSYDGLDRLLTTASPMFGGTDQTHRYTYDALDNLKSWKLAGVKDYADYVYDAQNRLTNIRNTANSTVVGLGYDLQGNVINKNGQGYDFDYGNRLRTATGKESYRYDGLGRRVQTTATDGSKTTLWQYTQTGQIVFSSDWEGASYTNQKTHENVYLAGSVVAVIDHNWPSNAVIATNYQHTDALGSPVAVTNAAGTITERNDYEPYGAVIGKPAYTGIGYTGHITDGGTGLTYMQQRYYDQSIGRFLSVDPVFVDQVKGDNFSRFVYSKGNPYRYLDPDGRQVKPVDFIIHGMDPSSTPSSMSKEDRLVSFTFGAIDVVAGTGKVVGDFGGFLLSAASPVDGPILDTAFAAKAGLDAAEALDGARGIMSGVDGKERPAVLEQVGGFFGGEDGAKAGRIINTVVTVRAAYGAFNNPEKAASDISDMVKPLFEKEPDLPNIQK